VDPKNISDPEARERYEKFLKAYPPTPITFMDKLKEKREKLKEERKDPDNE
jgi:hypothetical protein